MINIIFQRILEYVITAVCVVIKLHWPNGKSLSLSFLQEKQKYDTVLGLQEIRAVWNLSSL